MSEKKHKSKKRKKMLEPTQPKPDKDLSQPAKIPVVSGVPDEIVKRWQEQSKKDFEDSISMTSDEEVQALEKDSKLQQARLDNADLRAGKQTQSSKTKYVIWSAIAAVAGIATYFISCH